MKKEINQRAVIGVMSAIVILSGFLLAANAGDGVRPASAAAPKPSDACLKRAVPNLDPETPRNAFDDPEGFIECVHSVIAQQERYTINFYVALSKLSYGTTKPCPWPVDEARYGYCPFGSPLNNGRSPARPLDSFKLALEKMHEDKADHPDEDRHYTLNIRGGNFTYKEALVITANATINGERFKGPYLYDANQEPVKVYVESQGGNNQWISSTYHDPQAEQDVYASLGNSTIVVADVTVKPYNNETVTLDGGCEFYYPSGVSWGDPNWSNNDEVMDAVPGTCNAIWPQDASGNYAENLGMVTVRRAYRVKVEGLTVKNSPYDGIKVFGISSHVIVKDNVIDNTYARGLYAIGSSDLLLEGNRILRASAGSVNANVTLSWLENFAVFNNIIAAGYNDAGLGGGIDTTYGTVHDNRIHDNASTGIYINPATGDGMHQIRYDGNIIDNNMYANCLRLASENEAPLSEIIVSNNICHGNMHGIWVAGYCQREQNGGCTADPTEGYNDCCGDGVEMRNIFIVNNTVWGNGGAVYTDPTTEAGYGFRATNPYAVAPQNVYVVNNVFAENWFQQLKIEKPVREDADGDGYGDNAQPIDSNKLIMRNNILYCNKQRDFMIDLDGDGRPDMFPDANGDGILDCLADDAQEYPGSVVDDDILDLQVDPDLRDPLGGDFHLCVTSPAIDQGVRRVFEPSVLPPVRDIRAPSVDFEDDTRDTAIDIGADELNIGGAGC
jgi:hypothetical protein